MAKTEEPKPKKFTFRGAVITGYDFRVPEKGSGAFLKIHFRADFTDTVCGQMGWLTLPDTFKKGNHQADAPRRHARGQAEFYGTGEVRIRVYREGTWKRHRFFRRKPEER